MWTAPSFWRVSDMAAHGKGTAGKAKKVKRIPLAAACACIAVGILLAVAFFLGLGRGQDGSPPLERRVVKKPRRAAAAPATSASAERPAAKAPEKEKWTPENDRVRRDENKRVVYDPDAPLGSKANPINIDAMKFPDNPIQPKRKLFGTHAENYICGLMRTTPGNRIIMARLPANFDEEFKAHIADPVEITEEDTEEDIELKRQMHEFKKAAAELIGEGMTPTEIILQERKELNRIADHRAMCAAEIGRLKREGASEQEIEDCVNAANIVMEQYGARKFMTDSQIKKMLLDKNSNRETK